MLRLLLNSGQNEKLYLSFHAIGPRFRGLIGVVAYLERGGTTEHVKGSSFQINYEEAADAAQTRFSEWLEQVIVQGLNQWRRTL